MSGRKRKADPEEDERQKRLREAPAASAGRGSYVQALLNALETPLWDWMFKDLQGVTKKGVVAKMRELLPAFERSLLDEERRLDGLPPLPEPLGVEDVLEGIAKKMEELKANRLLVYTDGSHIKGTRRLGGGGVVVQRDRQFRFALGRDYAAGLGADASNPTMELAAAAHVLERIRALYGEDPPMVTLAADYVGVVHYINGTWEPKDEDTAFQRQARRLVDVARGWPGLRAVHVKGHSGDRLNDLADAMAKRAEPLDELDGLLK